MNEFNNWELLFYKTFNTTYQSYLGSISPIVFMNTFLNKIIKITNSESGFIGGIININGNNFISLEAINNKLILDDDIINSSNLLINIDETNTLFTHAIKINKILYVNNSQDFLLFDKSIKKPANIKTCICIPYSFNDQIIGIIVLANRKSYNDHMIPNLKILGNLTAILQNNYSKLKKTNFEIDSRFIIYQLLEHVFNITRDGIIITTNSFEPIYINKIASYIISLNDTDIKVSKKNKKNKSDNINFINDINDIDDINEMYTNTNLLGIFPQLKILDNRTDLQNKLFKNRRIEILLNNNFDNNNDDNNESKKNKNSIVLEFIINSVICHGNIYHIFMIYNNIENFIAEQRNQTNFIAFLSHELRNPLQSLNLANHLLQTKLKNNYQETYQNNNIDSYLNSIKRSCNEMKKIINDILDFSKIEANEFTIELDLCNINELATNIMSEHIELVNEKGLEFKLNLSDNIPTTLFTDEIRLHQILSNLILNAIKYSNKGIIELYIECDTCENDTNVIKFNVIDQGQGIRKQELPNLFKQYCQTSCSDKFNSNGLGLCVSQKIAKLLGGKITVKSEYKKGSTFTLYHPIKLGNSGSFCEKSKISKNLEGNILIVDDNETNLVLFGLMLENFNNDYNYKLVIHKVSNGLDAIESCKINNYDIIFMDINMPNMNGCTASKIIIENGYKGKIVAITGNILAKKENSIKCGKLENYNYFNDVVIKPYDDLIILKILNKYLKDDNNLIIDFDE